ncbi:DUF5906 domain-containing protein [Microvirga massiliensis]|uniref:DUF5906 domain-containing protein n=1 Tax=Microvirga massiliensis TaxID=1033741 RepID=UPI00062BE181|nr:DUF5906 domain-containing protein [Microvirga massiliensis]
MTISPPKTGTGIRASLVQSYDYTRDAAWTNPQDPSHGNFAKFSYLTEFAVQVGDTYYLRDKFTSRWTNHGSNSSNARRILMMQRGGTVQIGGIWQTITADDIKLFFSTGLLHLEGTIYAPGCGDFVIFSDEKRLNTYVDKRLAGDTDHLANTEEFLKVIRNSLCNEPDELPLAAMLDEINSNRPTPFRWVIHWLAARYQKPGFAPQTNLWFIGKRRGTGKGTVISAMRELLGGQTVGKASQEDIAKGWTDCFLHKELMEWDEFKASGGWRDFSNLLKEKTGNSTLTVNRRNVGVSTHPAVAMHIFASNESKPILVEEHDRQNTFVETCDDPAWTARAKALWNQTTREFVDPNMISGFAALLNEITIDIPFICAPLMTPKRAYLLGISEDSVKRWVEGGGADSYRTDKQPCGGTVVWEALYNDYKVWVRDYTHHKPEDLKGFKQTMKDHGYAAKDDPALKVKQPDGTRKSMRVAKLTLPALEEFADDVVDVWAISDTLHGLPRNVVSLR